MDQDELATAFDEAATSYQAARPDYPSELFDDVTSLAGISPGDRLLEIGAGPGKATVEFARRGFAITALEPGLRLAQQARLQLSAFAAVSVITTGFEEWDPPEQNAFELVYAANAWHWLDPEIRCAKAAALLRPSGRLAIFGAGHAFPEGFDPFFTEIQSVYDELGEGRGDCWPPPKPSLTNDGLVDEAVASGHFRPVDRRLYVWAVEYDADGYIALLNTFSNHIVMAPAKRERLFTAVRDLLAERPDGRLTRHWMTQLAVLQRI